jgi:Dyp-type peroxidase family
MTAPDIGQHDSAVVTRPLRFGEDAKQIQGNILAGFNKPRQVFLFLSFNGSQKHAQAWLAKLIRGDTIANTDKVAKHNEEYRDERGRRGPAADPKDPQLWVSVSLTYQGLRTLHPELEHDLQPYEAFRKGPRRRAALLGDVDPGGDYGPENWVIGRLDNEPDALVTIAGDHARARPGDVNGRPTLDHTIEEQLKLASDNGLRILRQQHGNAQDDGKVHFGFRDGISQPGVYGFTEAFVNNRRWEDKCHPGSPIIAAGEFVLGHVGERRQDPDSLPWQPAPRWMKNGSFQVFRRLTQDSDKWEAGLGGLTADLTSATGLLPNHEMTWEDLAAKAMGRSPNGMPLTLPLALHGPSTTTPGDGQEECRFDQARDNDFNFDNDPQGLVTPRWAHIRKTNPRNDARFYDRTHRMLRRGIPFTERKDEKVVERGLLFNAFMASIENQFEFVQRHWANNPRSTDPSVVDGPDPLIGRNNRPCTLWEPQGSQSLKFPQAVRTTGAVYAFAPSIDTLRMLARGEPIATEV